MAITLGAEVALSLHLDTAATYGALETALVDAGFTAYVIMRNLNGDGSSDAQLYVRSTPDQNGMQSPLPAADTLGKLHEALAALEADEEPEPDPEPEPEPEPTE